MSIATVVTRGYGSFGSIPEIVTRGYGLARIAPDEDTTSSRRPLYLSHRDVPSGRIESRWKGKRNPA
jgi:hypothetical protein